MSPAQITRSGAIPQSKEEHRQFVKETSHLRLDAYASLDSVTIGETHGYRVRVAYRLVSNMCRALGLLQGVGTISPILQAYPIFSARETTTLTGAEHISELFRHMENLSDVYSLEFGEMDTSSMCLLPPPIPDRDYDDKPDFIAAKRQRGIVPNLYDPKNDILLELWCRTYDEMAVYLGMGYGTKEDPLQDVYGLSGMVQPNSARFLWPTSEELQAFEIELLLWVYDQCSESSIKKSEITVIEHLGYTRPEAVMLVKTAMEFGSSIYADATTNTRIIENKRLDHLYDKAVSAEDYRAGMVVRKQAHLINGLTKEANTGGMEDYVELASKATDIDNDNRRLEG